MNGLRRVLQGFRPSSLGLPPFFLNWLKRVGPFWAVSVAGHLMVLIVLALVLGTVHVARNLIDVPPFIEAVDNAIPDPDSPPIDFDKTLPDPPPVENIRFDVDVAIVDPVENAIVDPDMVLTPQTSTTWTRGVSDRQLQDIITGSGHSDFPSTGHAGNGNGPPVPPGTFIGRQRDGEPPIKVPPSIEAATVRALDWLKRHQSPDGSWSLDKYAQSCRDSTCTGLGTIKSNAAATAMGLLPFLGTGQTHRTGNYKKLMSEGLFWLVKNQQADGNLAAPGQNMYVHGLCSITLCEAYALTKDKKLGSAAQLAVRFIEQAQNQQDGGWRYKPGETPGDTSVVGWQIMSLKSAQMAGLEVDPAAFARAKDYLRLASSKSAHGGLFGYLPGSGGTPAMTAVGLLCTQYLGARRTDPANVEGAGYLMKNLPDINRRNIYYWYYATQAMHNLQDSDWDTWNRAMRKLLIATQVKEGCAAGSWDPDKPTKDQWGDVGGRLMCTSLGALTLEVYYRFLPLYKLDKTEPVRPRMADAKGKEPPVEN
jgi:squalene-hopene cyclase-like protein/prenyltransferase/squalene oxidase-like repeat protein